MPNHLANATSPYLLQHAENPVDWWEWCDAAFAEAKTRDLPIFLSIGYSACHWCHVMAHESFESQEVADFLNANFISIKVDREERPDIDSIYMDATVALTGHGGWPMSVFLDQDARPFYAGTYFPPRPSHGLPSFRQLIDAISDAWQENRGEILKSSANIVSTLAARSQRYAGTYAPTSDELSGAVKTLEHVFDAANGGFGGAPKFPPSMILEFLLNEYARSGDETALAMAEETLTAMARGGIYDQLGGGFARYSVDANWVVPHFEKMLYDNALLLRVYTHWWRLTGSLLGQRIVHETAEFLLREMRTKEGGFASSLDADSEGKEGTFYVWHPATVHQVLGRDDADWVCELLAITPTGTFEDGCSTLQLRNDASDVDRWSRVRETLMDTRNKRQRPARDDKIIAAWNGLAISALTEAGVLFDKPEWVAAAESAADLLIRIHVGNHGPGRLSRTSRNGVVGFNWGTLDDYGDCAEGFLALYQATGDSKWFDRAGELLGVATTKFADGAKGFFYTDEAAPSLVRRPKILHDSAEPSGWFAIAKSLITFSALTGNQEYRRLAEDALHPVSEMAVHSPIGVGWGLVAAQALLSGPLQMAIIGPDGEARRHFVQAGWRSTKPGNVMAFGEEATDSGVELLRGRVMIQGKTSAYVCRGFVCDQPTNDLGKFQELIDY